MATTGNRYTGFNQSVRLHTRARNWTKYDNVTAFLASAKSCQTNIVAERNALVAQLGALYGALPVNSTTRFPDDVDYVDLSNSTFSTVLTNLRLALNVNSRDKETKIQSKSDAVQMAELRAASDSAVSCGRSIQKLEQSLAKITDSASSVAAGVYDRSGFETAFGLAWT